MKIKLSISFSYISSKIKYYTLNISKQIGQNTGKNQLFISLFHTNYKIWIHDPNFFIINNNPSSIPFLMKLEEPSKTSSHYYRLFLTEVEELDLPEDPCNPDPSYSFQACVRRSLSSQVGCRTRWDRWSHKDMPLCTQVEQFR